MKKPINIMISITTLTIVFMAGALVSTQITSMQNREIWRRVLKLIETGELVNKTTLIN